jgi:hypothetical protein
VISRARPETHSRELGADFIHGSTAVRKEVKGACQRRPLLIFRPKVDGALLWKVRPFLDTALDGQLGSKFHDEGPVDEDRHTPSLLPDGLDRADCPFDWFGSFTHGAV